MTSFTSAFCLGRALGDSGFLKRDIVEFNMIIDTFELSEESKSLLVR